MNLGGDSPAAAAALVASLHASRTVEEVYLAKHRFQTNELRPESTSTVVDLSRAALSTPAEAALVVAFVNAMPRVTVLNLADTKLGPASGDVLAHLLTTNRALTSLNVCNTRLGTAGCPPIAAALKSTTTLVTINVLKNRMSIETATELVRVASKHASLRSLCGIEPEQKVGYFKSMKLMAEDAVLIAGEIERNTMLEHLILAGNALGDRINGVGRNSCPVYDPVGASALGEALKTNRTLVTLDMKHNSIFTPGGQAIAAAVRVNTTLEILDLGDCQLGPKGCIAIVQAVATNSTLLRLDISGNYCSDGSQVGEAIVEMVRVNNTLKGLETSGSNFSINAADFKEAQSMGAARRGRSNSVTRASEVAKADPEAQPAGRSGSTTEDASHANLQRRQSRRVSAVDLKEEPNFAARFRRLSWRKNDPPTAAQNTSAPAAAPGPPKGPKDRKRVSISES